MLYLFALRLASLRKVEGEGRVIEGMERMEGMKRKRKRAIV